MVAWSRIDISSKQDTIAFQESSTRAIDDHRPLKGSIENGSWGLDWVTSRCQRVGQKQYYNGEARALRRTIWKKTDGLCSVFYQLFGKSCGEYSRVGPMRSPLLEKPLTRPFLLFPLLHSAAYRCHFIVPLSDFSILYKGCWRIYKCVHCSGWRCYAISDICWTTGERSQEDSDNRKQIKFSKNSKTHQEKSQSHSSISSPQCAWIINGGCKKNHPGWKTPFAFSFVRGWKR